MLPKLCPPNGHLLFPANASAANHAPIEADTGMIHNRCNALIMPFILSVITVGPYQG